MAFAAPRWDAHPDRTTLGGYGQFLRTEDVSKFGQLCLQMGKRDGKEVLPAAWVEQAMTRQVSNDRKGTADLTHGYGYPFWRCRHNATARRAISAGR